MYDLVIALSGKLKSFLSEIFLVRQVLINHNRINWFLVSEEMKLSNPCTPWFATSPWNLHFSCRLTLLCLKGGVNKGIFFLLCSDAGDRSCNHCPAALPAAPDARCGGQVLHGKCVGKHIFPVRFEGVCSDWSGSCDAVVISPIQTGWRPWFVVSHTCTGMKSSFPFPWGNGCWKTELWTALLSQVSKLASWFLSAEVWVICHNRRKNSLN